jgi:hypothetical protein
MQQRFRLHAERNRQTRLFRIFAIIAAAAGLALLPILIQEQPNALSSTTEITYDLDWTQDRIMPNASGQGWSVINDLGYHVTVERGYLVTGSVQLIPCSQPDQGGTASWLIDWLLLAPAHAGHGGERDESKSTLPYVETLTKPTAVNLETVSVPQEALYCQAHYLVAYGVESAKNLPSEPDMIGTSLLVEGLVQASETGPARPFSIKTELVWGTITDLRATVEPADHLRLTTDGDAVTVILRRDLGALFDGVDFDRMPEIEQAKAVLRSVTNHTQVFVEQGSRGQGSRGARQQGNRGAISKGAGEQL